MKRIDKDELYKHARLSGVEGVALEEQLLTTHPPGLQLADRRH